MLKKAPSIGVGAAHYLVSFSGGDQLSNGVCDIDIADGYRPKLDRHGHAESLCFTGSRRTDRQWLRDCLSQACARYCLLVQEKGDAGLSFPLFIALLEWTTLPRWKMRSERKSKKNLLPLQAGDVPDTYADVDDLVKQFNYKPATRVEDGINRFVAWYRDYFKVEK